MTQHPHLVKVHESKVRQHQTHKLKETLLVLKHAQEEALRPVKLMGKIVRRAPLKTQRVETKKVQKHAFGDP